MTNEASPRPRRRGRSAWALFAGFLIVVILSIGTDLLLHATGVFPPWGEPMSDSRFVLATLYRTVYAILGSYVTARLAPDRPHAARAPRRSDRARARDGRRRRDVEQGAGVRAALVSARARGDGAAVRLGRRESGRGSEVMKNTETLQVTTPSDQEVQLTRLFDAPRPLVFDAFTKPELLKRWLFGPDGWSLAVCEIDFRVGGQYRYVWKHLTNGKEMGMSGVIHEIVVPERLVSTEKFDEAWYPGEGAVGTVVLTEQGSQTLLTQTIRYGNKEARDAALKTGMKDGMGASYDRLEGVFAELLQ